MNEIPVIDMLDQQNFIKQIHYACRHPGFFYLANHTIDPALMNRILTLSREFFCLPQEQKDEIDIRLSPCCRGYGRLEAEKTYGIGDYKETYDLGLERPLHADRLRQKHLRLLGPNQWPDSARLQQLEFRQTIISYISQMLLLGSQLMQAITTSLNYSVSEYDNYFRPENDDAHAMLRLLYYPASSTHKLGVGEHVDSGFISLLLQDDTGGLQILNHDKQWIEVPPLGNHFIVNIGEMLQSWSGNYYQATMHRVINHANRDRISAPFFFEPNLSTKIHVSQPDNPVFIYGEYLLNIFERSFPQAI